MISYYNSDEIHLQIDRPALYKNIESVKLTNKSYLHIKNVVEALKIEISVKDGLLFEIEKQVESALKVIEHALQKPLLFMTMKEYKDYSTYNQYLKCVLSDKSFFLPNEELVQQAKTL